MRSIASVNGPFNLIKIKCTNFWNLVHFAIFNIVV